VELIGLLVEELASLHSMLAVVLAVVVAEED
jgi:hypothetical protein